MCKFDSRKCNSNQNWNKEKCQCGCKNPKEHHVRGKDYIWNSATCSCKNGKYLANVIDDSVITCYFNKNCSNKKVIQKMSTFYLPFS